MQVFESEGRPGHIHVENHTFGEIGDHQKLSITLLFDPTEERSGLLASGTERGMNVTYRLDALLARLASR